MWQKSKLFWSFFHVTSNHVEPKTLKEVHKHFLELILVSGGGFEHRLCFINIAKSTMFYKYS